MQALPTGWRRGIGYPWSESGEKAGLVWVEGSPVGVADRPVVRGGSVRESVRREHGARSGRECCPLAQGGKEAGGCSVGGRCGKGAPVGGLAVRKCAVPFGEMPSMQAGAGWVVDGGAGGGYGG